MIGRKIRKIVVATIDTERGKFWDQTFLQILSKLSNVSDVFLHSIGFINQKTMNLDTIKPKWDSEISLKDLKYS